MKKFTITCPNCVEQSDENSEECSNCGALKTERLLGLGFFESLLRYFVNTFHLSKNLQFIIFVGFQIFLNIIILASFPNFFSESNIFIVILFFYSISHLTFVADLHYFGKKSFFSKMNLLFILSYFGAGLGILITNMGLQRFATINECFSFSFIFNEIKSGRYFSVFFGSFLIISFYFVFKLVFKDLENKES